MNQNLPANTKSTLKPKENGNNVQYKLFILIQNIKNTCKVSKHLIQYSIYSYLKISIISHKIYFIKFRSQVLAYFTKITQKFRDENANNFK
jgi:hypothetical protein